jgi:sec-independent protein translocase protein TatB
MFDIGWSELLVIGVVALIAIGPKELPGVLRMVGQWMGKARRMAAEFQGQFQEAMREAEMADLKKSFDEVREAASGFSPTGMISSLQRDVDKALDIEGVDKPAAASDASSGDPAVASSTPEQPSVAAAEAHPASADEPLAVVEEAKPAPQPPQESADEAERLKDAKAS